MNAESILTSIFLGLLATTSPCVLPLYPGFLAYLSGGQEKLADSRTRYLLGFSVLAGVLTMMLILGAGITALSIPVGQALSVFIPLSDLLIFGLGTMLLLNINPFKRLPQVQSPVLSNPLSSAFAFGLLYGPIALPCSGPLVMGIFAFSLTAGEALSKLSIFLWFGVGFGLPLLLLSFLGGSSQRWITRQLATRARPINFAAGLLLIGVAAYDFTQNWELIQAYFA
jgi:cytochrome c-type biogenesis protein